MSFSQNFFMNIVTNINILILLKKKYIYIYIKDCKIYSPFSQFKGNSLAFERFITPKGKDNVSLRLFENNEKIQMIFMHNYQECWDIVNCICRDLDNVSVKDIKEGKWYGAIINLFLEATHYATARKTEFDVNDFFLEFR